MKTQLSSLQQKQTFLKIMIFTLVTVIIWVGLTLFRTQQQTGIAPQLLVLAEPLNPNISLTVLDRIEQKRSFTEADLADFPIYSLVVQKSGEEELVVFTAADRVRRPSEGLEDVPVAPPDIPPGTLAPPVQDDTQPAPISTPPPTLFGPPPGTGENSGGVLPAENFFPPN